MDFYHVLNRGVDKRDVVMNDDDRQRFVRGLYLFNDRNAAPNAISQIPLMNSKERKRDLLVRLHAWCLMNNHYHLLLSPLDDDPENVSLFMKKLNMGYAKFFNEKYTRSGALWQGKYKKILIERDAQFQYIPFYIHLNPLDYNFPEWRKGGVKKVRAALDWLAKWKWSSNLDYGGSKNYPSLIDTRILQGVLGSKAQQEASIRKIITDEVKAGGSFILER